MRNILLAVFFITGSSFHDPFARSTHQLKGVVIAADTKEPVANAYLYIIKGEEEVLSNAKGAFVLTTAEKVPFTLTVIHKDFRQAKLRVSDVSQPLKVILERK